MVSRSTETEGSARVPPDTARLLEAFDLFNTASRELSDAYSTLQADVRRMSDELAAANARLREELLAKEALSQRLALLLEMLPGAVLLVDGEGQVQQMNPAAERLLGIQRTGWAWRSLPGLTLEGEDWLFTPSQGTAHRLSISVNPLPQDGGQILLLQDITANRERERATQRRERLAAMGETMAALAHQLRTPLATALLAVGQMSPDRDPAHFQRQQDRALGRLRHLQDTMDAMLQFLRGTDPADGGEVAVAEVLLGLEQAFSPLYRQKSVALCLGSAPGDWYLTGSTAAWVSVLGNLLHNALQFAPKESTVRVELVPHGREGVHWEFCDAGPGVAPELRETIFLPFYSTRREGTGLGLSLVRNFIEAMGGSIAVVDGQGSGACFRVYTPFLHAVQMLPSGNGG